MCVFCTSESNVFSNKVFSRWTELCFRDKINFIKGRFASVSVYGESVWSEAPAG